MYPCILKIFGYTAVAYTPLGEKSYFLALFLFSATLPAIAEPADPFRCWTSVAGATIEARFLRQSGAMVILEDSEGKQFSIRSSRLSQADQDYIREAVIAERKAEGERLAAMRRDRARGKPAAPKDAQPDYMSKKEWEVIEEMNLARQNPTEYAKILKQYRKQHVQGNIFRTSRGSITTREGLTAVDEAIEFLEKQSPLPPLEPSEGLTRAARDHAEDIGRAGIVGHTGSDGSTSVERISRHGRWRNTTGENCQFGHGEARDVVRQLIVDDGVPGRGHRTAIFNRAFGVAGTAIAPHRVYGSCCVIDFAGGFSD